MKFYPSLILFLLILSSCKESSKDNEIVSTTINTEMPAASNAPQVDNIPLIDDQKTIALHLLLKILIIHGGMTWLPDGDLLYTEKEGRLYKFNGSKSIEIKGVPEVYLRGQGGLLDVTVHPQFEKNNFIYISYASKMGGGDGGNSTIARAVLKNNKLEDLEVLYKAMPNSKKGQHFGSRFTWDREGHLYFSIGDRGNRDVNPQDIYKDCGKIYRINDDGSIPDDNPFVEIAKGIDTIGIKTAIYSYGNRNPQGMTTHPVTGKIIAHEHGPQGGDEINIIESGKNYGWPVISYGINYSGTTFTDITEKEGMEQPIYYWVPSIAPSGFAIINNPAYKEWNGNFLVGSLKFQYLEMLYMEGNRVTKREKVADKIGRLRNVKIGPDGLIYIAVEGKGIFKIEKK
ncbi:PQQ-dependent oxidoreductase [Nonlabens ulvanivorans]|uniref:PQQ-dependent oxidoreductase n=2 Tax=Nonlabens ulvanivorans TaxID=906888 RepID=A0A090WGL2_NONUL|nr:PQQ-dependent sugar dehydrogenase [Nonlabens ulvanivorans]GAL76200.1 PQQ-dependent oxidoreductase [Nonlabens ulvanivorans]